MFYNIAALILLFNCATCSNECLYRSCSCFVTNGEYYLTCQDTHYDLGINLSLVPVEIYSSNFKLNGLNLLKEESFKDLKVNSLDLSNNNLEEIPSRVNELTSLKALNLSHNRISILRTRQFDGLVDLISLDLSWFYRNQFTEIKDGDLDNLPSLKIINIDHNRIKRVRNLVFTALVSIETISLSFNINQD